MLGSLSSYFCTPGSWLLHYRAFKAIRRAEVVILMLDASQGLVDQDRILAQRIADEGRACVIALNKWDAVPDKDDKSYLKGEGAVC